MTISLIAAIAKNNVIGLHHRIPWHLPRDLAYFRKITLHKIVVMGRKTYESIGHALPNRTNIVLSSRKNLVLPNCHTFTHLQNVLSTFPHEDLMIIGGGQLYQQTIHLAQWLYLTIVDVTLQGDTFFPSIHPDEWETISIQKNNPDSKNIYAYTFITLKRRSASQKI